MVEAHVLPLRAGRLQLPHEVDDHYQDRHSGRDRTVGHERFFPSVQERHGHRVQEACLPQST